jgi:hypothetical protein
MSTQTSADIQLLQCPFCTWTTTKIFNEGKTFSKHLIYQHNVKLRDIVQDYPNLLYILEAKRKIVTQYNYMI